MAGRPFTVLQIISQASLELGVAQLAVSQAIGSPDQDIAQLTALLSAVADEVLMESPYEEALGDGYWLRGTDGTMHRVPKNDDDLVLFDGRLAINGIKWRFLAAKGLEFGEQIRDFTTRLNKLAAPSNARVLDLNADEERVQ